ERIPDSRHGKLSRFSSNVRRDPVQAAAAADRCGLHQLRQSPHKGHQLPFNSARPWVVWIVDTNKTEVADESVEPIACYIEPVTRDSDRVLDLQHLSRCGVAAG